MDSNPLTPTKSDSVAPIKTPTSDVVEKSEFVIRVTCETVAGSRSCKISDVMINVPHREQPTKVSPPIDSAVSTDSTDCDVCEILEDLTRSLKDDKTLPVEDTPPVAVQGRRFRHGNKEYQDTPGSSAPRRLPPAMRARRMSRS